MGVQTALKQKTEDRRQKTEGRGELPAGQAGKTSGTGREVLYDEGLYERFILWKDRFDKTTSSIAIMLNRSTAAVSNYINRKFAGNLVEFEKDLLSLLERQEDLEFVSGPDVFCNTEPSKLIWEVLQFCDQKRKMGVALAPSGTGKTETCKAYKRKNRATVFITADVSTRRVSAILNLFSKHVGGATSYCSISDMLHKLIDRLKNSNRLIIIDDAHFLTWEAFEAVRKLHDCAQVGIVYVGQERLYEQMKGGEQKAYLFDQIYSRIAIKRSHFRILKKDVEAIAQSLVPGLDKACTDFLWHKARSKGRFRLMANLLEDAIEMNKNYGKPIDIALLRQAERFLME